MAKTAISTPNSLLSLNASSGRTEKWYVRIVLPCVSPVSFTTKKNQPISGEKFTCILLGAKGADYVEGEVRFDFKDLKAAQKALNKFKSDTIWEMSQVSVMDGMAQWNGAPNKTIVLLNKTTMKPVMDSTPEAGHVAKFFDPAGTLAEISSIQFATTVDLSLYVMTVQAVREETARGQRTKVRTLDVCDASGVTAQVSVWGNDVVLFNDSAGKAFVFVGLYVTNNGKGVSMRYRSGGLFAANGHPKLTELVKKCSDMDTSNLTSVTRSAGGKIDCTGPAQLACAAILETLRHGHEQGVSPDDKVVFQLMQVSFAGALDESTMLTKDGSRLYVQVQVRDWSGKMTAHLLEEAALSCFQCKSKDDVMAALAKNDLVWPACRFNVRGVRRGNDVLIAELTVADPSLQPSAAFRQMASIAKLCGPSQGGMAVTAVPNLKSTSFSNLTVRLTDDMIMRPYRALCLVRGTSKSVLLPSTGDSESGARVVLSKGVECEISGTKGHLMKLFAKGIDIFNDPDKYKVDTQIVIATISGLLQEDDATVLVAEAITPVPPTQVDAVRKALMAEIEIMTEPREAQSDAARLSSAVRETPTKRARTITAYPSDPPAP